MYFRNIHRISGAFILLSQFFVGTACHANRDSSLSAMQVSENQSKWIFWSTQQKGTNLFNKVERFDRMDAAKELGVSFVRLTPTKWDSSGTGGKGTFLFGTFDDFNGLVEADFLELKKFLDHADQIGLKIVITFLSVNGRVWNQHYQGPTKYDLRLWKNEKYRKDLGEFWKALASRLKDHPAVVGYNIINEPGPELADHSINDWYGEEHRDWCHRTKGSLLDLNRLYNEVIGEIRKVDPVTPIVVDSGYMGVPLSTLCFDRLEDDKVLYSFHMYEPYEYALGNRNNNWQYSYPGSIPVGEGGVEQPMWNRNQIDSFLKKIADWQQSKGITSNEVYVGEFGVLRLNQGADKYLADIISIFDKNNWHWSFYSFREDTWEAIDYELGDRRNMGSDYWEAVERGEDPYPLRLPLYRTNPTFNAIKNGLNN